MPTAKFSSVYGRQQQLLSVELHQEETTILTQLGFIIWEGSQNCHLSLAFSFSFIVAIINSSALVLLGLSVGVGA